MRFTGERHEKRTEERARKTKPSRCTFARVAHRNAQVTGANNAPMPQAGLRAGRLEHKDSGAVRLPDSFTGTSGRLPERMETFRKPWTNPPAYRCGGSAGFAPASRAPEAGEV